MKNFTISAMLVSFLAMSNYSAQAQQYSFTLIHNSDFSFTIAAVPDFDSGTFQPITQSYGFVIVVPDGITVTVDQYLPTGTAGTLTPINGADVTAFDPSMADNDLYLITTDTAGRTLAAHASGVVISLVTLTVNGSPTSGEISMLDNDSTLANAPELLGSLDSFIQVDVIDNGTVMFANEFSGLTGMTSFDFSTLGFGETELIDSAILFYPNPASEVINIQTNLELTKVELFDVLGKRIFETGTTKRINIEPFKAGIYFLKVHTTKGTVTKKMVIE